MVLRILSNLHVKLVVFVEFLLLSSISTQPAIQQGFADFVPFPRQIIKDDSEDAQYIDLLNSTIFPLNESFAGVIDYPDIASVSYSSDGKKLDAVIWHDSFNPKSPLPSASAPEFAIHGILIDVDSNPGTGDDGVDYKMQIMWDNHNQRQIESLTEYSTNGLQTRTMIFNNSYLNRTYDETYKYSFLQYTPLVLDLKHIGSPEKFRVMFFLERGVITEKVPIISNLFVDVSSWVDVPSSAYSILSVPNPLVIRQGEEKIVGVQVKSAEGFIPQIIDLVHPTINSTINWDFNPERLTEASYRIEPGPLKLVIPQNALPGEYNIPVLANISTQSAFPAKFIASDLSHTERQISGEILLSAYVARLISTVVRLPSTEGYIVVPANLTLTVQNQPTVDEWFTSFWNTWGSFISLVGGGFLSGLSALAIDRFRSKKH
jgi:hypothetical protein